MSAAVALALLLIRGGVHAQAGGPIQNVFVIVFENYNWSDILDSPSAPYFNSILSSASRAEQYYNPPGIHASTPNYLWMEAGQDFGLTGISGFTPALYSQNTTNHLVTELSSAGISWKTYQESMTAGQCPLTDSGLYAVRHNPFVFFTDVTYNNNPASAYCIAHNRPLTELATDLSNGTVARYNFIVPNVCNDMHDCSIATGDSWLAAQLPQILASPAYQNGGAVFITWDEGEGSTSDGPIGMIVMSPAAKGHGYYNTTYYTHSSLLLTLQEIFDVRPLLGDAANAVDLSDLFASFPAVVPSTPTPADSTSGVSINPTLRWSSSGASDSVYFGTSNPPPLVASGVAMQSYSPGPLVSGTAYYWKVVSQAAGGTTTSPVWKFTTGAASLPWPWMNQDVGAVGAPGSASYATNAFTANGAGADIAGTADAFQFIDQAAGGAVQISARVASLQNAGAAAAKAGVTLRDTTDAGSPHVTLDVKADGTIEMIQRSTGGGTTTARGSASIALPAFLRLTRVGTTVTGAVSTNGVTWLTVGTATVTLPGTVPLLGLAVTSRTTAATAAALFDNVVATSAVAVAPAAPTPADGASSVSTSPTLSWTAPGATSYDVYFGTTNPPPSAVAGSTSAAYSPAALGGSTTYYWQVIAHDSFGATAGPIWSFKTTGTIPGVPGSPTPAAGDTNIGTTPAPALTWTATSATSYDVSFGTVNPPGAPVAIALTNASYRPTSALTPNTTYYWQVTARNNAGTTTGPVWTFTSSSGMSTPPPAPWTDQDVGATGLAGSGTANGTEFTIKGAGADVWDTSDAFNFISQPFTGDGQVVARVTALQNTNVYAKAGVMFRDSADPASAHVMLDITPGGGVEFLQRSSRGGATAYLGGAAVGFPAWVRLTRSGTIVTAAASADGESWKTIGTATVAAGSTLGGIAVCSHTTTALTSATLDNMSVTAAAASAPPTAPGSPSPANGLAGIIGSPTLTWTSAGANSYDVNFGATNPPASAATGLVVTSYAPPAGLAPGTTYFWQVTARNSAGATAGPVWSFTTNDGSTALPPPWTDQDVGATVLPGSAIAHGDILTIEGAGADVWGNVDAFHFVSQPFTGDGEIVARVTALQNTSLYAKAGVMFRDSMSAAAAHVLLDVTPDGDVEFLQRAALGGGTSYLGGGPVGFPAWVRLTRSGTTITAATSQTGTTWTTVGTTTAAAGSALAGVAVTSHNTATLTTATVDNLAVNPSGTLSPPTAPASPAPADAATGVATNVALSWTASGATSYTIKFGTSPTPPQVATGVATPSYTPTGMLAGTRYYWQIVAVNAAGSTAGPLWSFTTAPVLPPPTLPAPWMDEDVGDGPLAGSASYANNVFTVSGAGSSISGKKDSFNYAYQALTTNGQIIARVTGVDGSGSLTEAGVMVRASLAANAAEGAVAVTADGTLSFVVRGSSGGRARTLASTSQNSPIWLKLARSGSTVTTWWSSDGTSWTQIGKTTSVTLNGTIDIGLVVVNGSTTALATATFDNVTVSPLP